jgi:hypothetical protein
MRSAAGVDRKGEKTMKKNLFSSFLRAKQTKYGTFALVFTLVLLATVLVVNLVVFAFRDQYGLVPFLRKALI